MPAPDRTKMNLPVASTGVLLSPFDMAPAAIIRQFAGGARQWKNAYDFLMMSL